MENLDLSVLSHEEEGEIFALREKNKKILSSVYTIDVCKRMLRKVLTVDLVKDISSFRRDRYNWLRAIQVHPVAVGSEIALLLFDSYFGDNDIERNQMAGIWKKLLNKMQAHETDQRNFALLWRQLGILEASTGDFKSAIEHFQNSSKIAEKLGDNIIIGDNYFELGLIFRNQGEYVQAWASFVNAEKSVQALNHYKTIVYSQGQRANLLAIWGRFDDAIDLLKQSLSLWEKFDTIEDQNMRHTTLHTLGRIYLQAGRVKDAKEAALESLKLKEASGERYDSTMRTRSLLADACMAMGNYAEAKEYISEESIETSIRIGSYLYAAESLRTLSRVYYYENNYAQSERLAKRSLEIAQTANNPLTQIDTVIWIIQLSFLQKKFLVLFSALAPLIKAITHLRLTPVQAYNLFIQRQAVLRKSIEIHSN